MPKANWYKPFLMGKRLAFLWAIAPLASGSSDGNLQVRYLKLIKGKVDYYQEEGDKPDGRLRSHLPASKSANARSLN
jgi:hypothetical protein